MQPYLELRPPSLKVLVLKDLGADGEITGLSHPYVTVSIRDTMKTLCKALVSAVTPRINIPYRIWKIECGDFPGSQFPTSKLASSGAELVEETDKTVEENMIQPDDPFVVEFQENGSWIVDASQIVPPPPPSIHAPPPGVPPPLFGPGSDFFANLNNNRTSFSSIQSPSPLQHSSSSKANESSVVPFKSGFSKTGRKTVQEPGTLGLGNMYALKLHKF